jgi:hypothetical protein
MGEFLAEDAASPAYVEIGSSYGSLTDWKTPTGSPQAIPAGVPLEPLVEREAVTPDLSLSVELGQTFELLLGGTIAQRDAFRAAFPIALPANPDPDTVRFFSICDGRATDGVALFRALQSGAPTPPVPVPTVLTDFQAWVTEVFGDIGADDPVTWNPNLINYEVKAEGTLPSNTAGEFTATPARDGAFDWFAFDLVSQTTTPPAKPPTKNPSITVIPTHVRFRGMPNAKWWDFENNVTDYGAIDVQRQDLAKLAAMDFMLLHGNDWFLAPVDIPVNSLYQIESFLVRDVFGGLTLVDRTDRTDRAKTTGGRWTMFSTVADGGVADFFLLPPTASVAMQTGGVLEDLRFLRDPTANMNWAIEFEVEGGIGQPLYGAEEDARNRPAPSPPGGPAQAGAVIRYQIETPVPTDWFPYVPVEVTNVVTQVVLRQGEVERGTPSLVVPKGRVLPGVKELREQEVPRTGVRITRVANRSRWLDGSTHLWIARRKTSGQGEGSSGLKFDLAIPE